MKMIRLIPYAVSTMSIATESLMIATLLPSIAQYFHVSVSVAGQLLTYFALTSAVCAPIMAVILGSFPRRHVAALALLGLSLLSALTFLVSSLEQLLVVRVLIALCTCTAQPIILSSAARANRGVAEIARGRSLSYATLGFFLALTVVVPISVWAGANVNWRVSYAVCSVLAALSALLLAIFSDIFEVSQSVSLGERIRLLVRPGMINILFISAVTPICYWSVYPFLVDIVKRKFAPSRGELLAFLFFYGISSVSGNLIGGHLADRFNFRVSVIALLSLLFVLCSALYIFLYASSLESSSWSGFLLLIFPWCIVTWALPVIQQARMVSFSGELSTVGMALNQSTVQLAIACGAAVGSYVYDTQNVGQILLVSAAFPALGVLWMVGRQRTWGADI